MYKSQTVENGFESVEKCFENRKKGFCVCVVEGARKRKKTQSVAGSNSSTTLVVESGVVGVILDGGIFTFFFLSRAFGSEKNS